MLPGGAMDNEDTVDGLSAVEQLVCDIAAERWRNGKRVLIAHSSYMGLLVLN
jgi:DNA polymerase IIIc chi subunit